MGKGVDRHLFALRKWSERLNLPTPAMFEDDTYKVYTDIRLSTSTLSSPSLEGGGFGPVSRTSYGVGYGTNEIGSQFHVTSYNQTTDTDAMCEALGDACLQVQELIRWRSQQPE